MEQELFNFRARDYPSYPRNFIQTLLEQYKILCGVSRQCQQQARIIQPLPHHTEHSPHHPLRTAARKFREPVLPDSHRHSWPVSNDPFPLYHQFLQEAERSQIQSDPPTRTLPPSSSLRIRMETTATTRKRRNLQKCIRPRVVHIFDLRHLSHTDTPLRDSLSSSSRNYRLAKPHIQKLRRTTQCDESLSVSITTTIST